MVLNMFITQLQNKTGLTDFKNSENHDKPCTLYLLKLHILLTHTKKY